MGILSKIFGGTESTPADEAAAPTPECAHGALVPRWDNAADMGKADRVSHYYCEGCGSTFSPAEAEHIRIEL